MQFRCAFFISPEIIQTCAGAKQAIFGTNPICMSVPAAGGPVTMDMATAAYAWFGVLEAKTAGRPLPEGVAMDAQGRDTTDPEAVLSGGALKVFDASHKGSALALFVELLAGPLVGAAVADKLEEKNWGNLIVAINPSLLQVRLLRLSLLQCLITLSFMMSVFCTIQNRCVIENHTVKVVLVVSYFNACGDRRCW
jgi:LDH2 family malate/lactate/ureidoglycolate dehydrogenase